MEFLNLKDRLKSDKALAKFRDKFRNLAASFELKILSDRPRTLNDAAIIVRSEPAARLGGFGFV